LRKKHDSVSDLVRWLSDCLAKRQPEWVGWRGEVIHQVMTRTNWKRIDVLFRFFVTGGKALLLGLAFWYLLLAVTVVVF
jgi:hypothetical protein